MWNTGCANDSLTLEGEEGTPKKRFAGAPAGTATSPIAWAENKEGEGDEADVMDAAVLAQMLNAGAEDEPEEAAEEGDEEGDEEEGAIPREWLLRANRIQKQHEAGQFLLNPRLGVECSFQMALAALRQTAGHAGRAVGLLEAPRPG